MLRHAIDMFLAVLYIYSLIPCFMQIIDKYDYGKRATIRIFSPSIKTASLTEGSSAEMSKRTAKSGALFHIVYNIEVGCFQ